MARVIQLAKAKFSVGQIVRHRNCYYRGVILIVNETYKASEGWYQKFGKASPRNQPWYHLLVDRTDLSMYEAECFLIPDDQQTPIKHPLLNHFFTFKSGRYIKLDAG